MPGQGLKMVVLSYLIILDKIINLSKSDILRYVRGMTTVSATQAKQRFAELLDSAQRGPVRIQRHERDVAVLVSNEEYNRLRENRWAEFNRLAAIAAEQAKANGLTEEILAEILAE
jgi:prevent-host-death family protein